MTPIALLTVLALAQTPQQAALTLQPAQADVQVDATLQLRASIGTAAVDPGTIRWVSLDPEIATIDSLGTVRALRPGSARMTAILGERNARATIRVPALPPARVELALPVTELPAGTGAPLQVVVYDRLGTVLAPAAVRFESDRTDVATVDATGRVLAYAPGTATIAARAGSATARTTVRVVANPARTYQLITPAGVTRTGDVVRLRLEARDANGREVGPLLPAWSVAGTGAQIDGAGAEGVFVAERPGQHTVTAYVGPQVVQRTVIDVIQRPRRGELTTVGHGPTVGHHAGDTWAFEGLDGRDYAIIGTFNHEWAKVFDITDQSSPVLTDSVRLDARRINDVKIHPNNRIAVLTREGASTRRNGIVLLDLTTPAHPTILSEYTETVTGGVHNVWIIGEHDLIYATHGGTRDIRIIDIADPRNPREVGRWGLDAENRSLHDVIVQDGYAYLSYWNDGLITLDAGAGTHGGTPTNPTFVSQAKYPGVQAHTAWRDGRYLFVGDEIFPPDWDASGPIQARGHIHVLDMTDIDNPVEVATYEVPEAGAHNFWVEDDLLYVGYYQAGLRVVDISGELRGNLYRQGREMAAVSTATRDAIVPNWSMTGAHRSSRATSSRPTSTPACGSRATDRTSSSEPVRCRADAFRAVSRRFAHLTG